MEKKMEDEMEKKLDLMAQNNQEMQKKTDDRIDLLEKLDKGNVHHLCEVP
jgi:hypothetical protein